MDEAIKRAYKLDPEQLALAGPAVDAVRSFRLLLFVGQRLRLMMDQRLRADGLTSQQGYLLAVVGAAGRPSLGEVAEAMSTTHQNVRQIATALQRKGMLTIASDAADGRIRRLEVTEASAPYWRSRDDGDFAAIDGWFAALSRDDQRRLVELLVGLAKSIA